MDPTQGENNPTPENRQPVFTPEPTPTPVAPTVEPAAGPMHPFFSNHPSQTFNTDTGDIILAGDVPVKPKLNKKPLIIGGIIAAVMVVVGVIVAFVIPKATSTNKVSTQMVIDAFGNYVKLLQNGDGSAESLGAEWQFAKLTDVDLTSTDLSEYALALTERYDVFLDYYNRAEFRVDSLQKQNIDDQLSIYGAALQITTTYLTSGDVTENIFQEYATGGKSAASSYIATVLPNVEMRQGIAGELANLMESYFNYDMEIDDIYDRQGCIKNKILDVVCVGDIEGSVTEQLDNITTKMTAISLGMTRNFFYLVQNFINMTKSLAGMIGELDA